MKDRQITTIKVSKQTVKELSKLKIHPRQSYEEVIVKFLEKNKKETEKMKLKNSGSTPSK